MNVPTLDDLLTTLAAGAGTGALYALFVLGMVLVYQVSKQVSFGYGQTGMVAALGSWFLYSQTGWPPVLAVAVAIAAATVISGATEVFVIRHVSKIRPNFDLIVTLGMFLVLTAGAQELFGSEAHPYLSIFSDHVFEVAGTFINLSDVFALVVAGVAIAGTYLILSRTGLGISIRACSESPDTARSFGINVSRLRTLVWATAGLIAGVASVLFASRLFVDTNFMIPVLITCLVASMVAGLDHFWPPLVIAFFFGIYESLIGLMFGATASVPAVFLLLIVVLTVAPQRWVAEQKVRP